ncbi:MAG: hypothetical protein IJK23_14845 [Clostridia bacterium]|nr:hypothetical protein [Clostridia bacterium]
MKLRTISLICVAALLLTLCACGTAKKDPDAQPSENTETTADETTGDGGLEPVSDDVGGWTWSKCEMDCFGYDTGGVTCYLSFDYPDCFKAAESTDSGEQYRGYYYNPENADATANESPYGIYAYFAQGGYSAKKDTFDEQIEGGLTERELGGRTVWFGELSPDQNTGSHAFVYYTAYSDDEWARLFVILCDPEADGAFRSTFEQSMNFMK